MTLSDRRVVIDASILSVALLAACIGSMYPARMLAVVGTCFLARMLLWERFVRDTGRMREMLLVVGCTLFGAANDWNTVVRKRVYDYTVPTDLPGFSSIPLWMLLLWGLILRFVVSLGQWDRIGPTRLGGDSTFVLGKQVRSAGLRVGLQLGLVLTTRLCIYRYGQDPWLSWLPFFLGLAAYAALFRPQRRELWIGGAFLVVGPIAESLLIQVAHLHRYDLGWFGGVPLWIVLWWVLGVLIVCDIFIRVHRLGLREVAPRPNPA